MDEVSKTGRTIIFVSHQMGSIAQLCQTAIMLDKGSLVMQDKAHLVIEHYTNQGKFQLTSYTADVSAVHSQIYVQNASVLNSLEEEQSSFRHDEPISIKVQCKAQKMLRGAELRMAVKDSRNILAFVSDVELNELKETTKIFEVNFTIPAHTLRSSNYSLAFALIIPHQLVIESMPEDILFFSIYDAGTKYAQSEGLDYGIIFSPCRTSVKQII
jgi:lipopolysaccharide transport system ATP-binding protein